MDEGMGRSGETGPAVAPPANSLPSVSPWGHHTAQRLFLYVSGPAGQMTLHVGCKFLFFQSEGNVQGKSSKSPVEKVRVQTTDFLSTNIVINHSHNFQSLGPWHCSQAQAALPGKQDFCIVTGFPRFHSEHLLYVHWPVSSAWARILCYLPSISRAWHGAWQTQ